jgi:nucleoside-diphosphate-sugar epimerase
MGEESERRLDESAETAPENAYGLAKLHAERAVLETGRRRGMRATVLRLPMVYGPGNKGNLPRMIEAIRNNRFPPPPDVYNRRSMVHVDDTVQAMLLAAVHKRADGQVYIVTDDRVYSTRDIYRMIAINLGRRPPGWSLPLWSIRLGARIGDMLLRLGLPAPLNSGVVRKLFGSAWYSADKIRDELGFEPHYDLERALPDIVAGMSRGSRGVEEAGSAVSERAAPAWIFHHRDTEGTEKQ